MNKKQYSDEMSEQIGKVVKTHLKENPQIVDEILRNNGLLEKHEHTKEKTIIHGIFNFTFWYIKEIIKVISIFALIILGWQQLELYMLGEIKPSDVDTIVALILTTSLYMHVRKNYVEK